MRARESVRSWAKSLSNIHLNDAGKPAVIILSAPRSGSTWLMELVLSQPGFKPCNEPFNLRKHDVVETLRLSDWAELYDQRHLTEIDAYLTSFVNGGFGVGFKNLLPHENHHRFITRRLVFKILHAGEDLIHWFADTFNAKILFMLRHPVPVSLSRTELPRLKTLMSPPYRDNFSQQQLRMAEKIFTEGDHVEKAVLDWCLQNAVPLRKYGQDVLLITYEQLVLKPEPIVDLLMRELELNSRDAMLDQLERPSRSTSKSTAETVAALKEKTNKNWLVEKWKEKISREDEARLMQIVETFEIDVYENGACTPTEAYWVR
ncbi:MAG: sulfotransferase [Gammaproteobacteria bacterium]